MTDRTTAEYRARHRSTRKAWQDRNRAKANAYQRAWAAKNKEFSGGYTKRRRATDIQFRLRSNLRSRLTKHLKTGSAVRDLGCTIVELRTYLEARFAPGMTWANYGKWHIDHIRPLASFDLTDREQLLSACHYTNLQPLWAAENVRKGATLDVGNVALVTIAMR